MEVPHKTRRLLACLEKLEGLACSLDCSWERLPLGRAVCSDSLHSLHHPAIWLTGRHTVLVTRVFVTSNKVFATKLCPLTHFAHSSICQQLFKTSFLAKRDLHWPRIISLKCNKRVSAVCRARQQGPFLTENSILTVCQTAPRTENSHPSPSTGSDRS